MAVQERATFDGWPIAAVGFISQTAAAFGFLAMPLLAPPLAARTGLDPRDFSFAGSFVFMAASLSSPSSGSLTRRLGSIRMLFLLFLGMAASILVVLSGTWVTTMLACFLFGLFYGPFGPAASTLVATRTNPARRGLFMAIRQSGVPFAGAIAGRLIPPVILAYGFHAGVLTISGAILLGALLVLAAPGLHSASGREMEPRTPAPISGSWLRRFLRRYQLPSDLQVVAVTAIGFAIAHLGLSGFAYFYLLEAKGFSEIAAGAYLSNVLLAAALGRPLMGLIVDATGAPLKVLAGIALLGAASFVALMAVDQTTPALVLVLLATVSGVSANTWTPVFMTAISNAAPVGEVGEYNGRAFSFASIGWMLAAPVVWTLIEIGGYALPFTLLCGLEVVMAATLLLIVPRLRASRC